MYNLYNIRRFNLFFCLLLLMFSSYSSATIEPEKTDSPVDSNFEVLLRNNNTYCVSPYLSSKDNVYYAYEAARADSLDCITYTWRYDVQGHISTSITDNNNDDRFLCMTDTATSNRNTYYYIELKPCSINNTRQIWKYNNQTQQMVNQHTGNRLQEINWFLATSANTGNLYDLKVTGRQILFALVPPPMTLSYDFNFHYSYNAKSYNRILGKDGKISNGTLRYNPANKQISTIMPDGKQYCLRSNMIGSTKDSEFISFQQCPDKYADGITPLPLKWNITSSVNGQLNQKSFILEIEDVNGNIFGVERAGGIDIGTGFTIKPNNLKQVPDRFKPLYVFNDAGETIGRQSYISGNYFGSLRNNICPSPGTFTNPPDNSSMLRLPANFNINLWLSRLYKISTHPGGSVAAGTCGPCFLHAIEMVLEMHRHGNMPPIITASPQFFTLSPRTTSLDSFRTRYPAAFSNFRQIFDDINPGQFDPLNTPRDEVLSAQHLASNVLSTMLGGSGLTINSRVYYNRLRELGYFEYQAMLNTMRNSPVGTMFILTYSLVNQQGQEVGHALSLVRTATGLHLIPSAESPQTTLQQFTQRVTTDIQTPATLEQALRLYAPASYPHLTEAVVFTLSPSLPTTPEESFDQNMLSVGNCTIGGAAGELPNVDHGSGSGISFAALGVLFQCIGGRCNSSRKLFDADNASSFTPNWGRCEHLQWLNGRWSWNGGSYWANRFKNPSSCWAANRCQSGGACYRWTNSEDIGVCQHLWRNHQGRWTWFDTNSFTREQTCRDANQCNKGGACYRWNEKRPQ
ncbi:hypothetical protein NFHSH190041_06940 [Shewanella sp. NFH-SH190041]|uniref:DUF1561 domain-containing protein n=1 Tax=Shewanella sp. NFH-SH190041 TaxID=2950245 RepID=UPI0021C32B53|nr:DUF1561 domain-containing protein [Shewanella sp. NFH-SH190041]BDM63242.1 hypothetical protein NFHSH190041_06940 [Shewanella sp. NFH-SH190041]